MTFNINDALSEGWDRLTTATGAQLLVAFVAAALAMTVVTNSLMRLVFVESGLLEQYFTDAPPEAMNEFRQTFTDSIGAAFLDLPLEGLVALAVVLWLGQVLLRIGAMRWFVEQARTSGLTGSLFTRRILWTLGNLLVGGILYAVTVGIGAIFLLVPGIYLAVALFFYNYEIVVEGENALEALSNSWSMTKGNRLDLFLLGLLFFVIGTVLGWITGPFTIGDPTVRALVSTTVTTLVGILGLAVAAAAYRQLSGQGPDDGTDELGAVGPDEL